MTMTMIKIMKMMLIVMMRVVIGPLYPLERIYNLFQILRSEVLLQTNRDYVSEDDPAEQEVEPRLVDERHLRIVVTSCEFEHVYSGIVRSLAPLRRTTSLTPHHIVGKASKECAEYSMA